MLRFPWTKNEYKREEKIFFLVQMNVKIYKKKKIKKLIFRNVFKGF